MTLRVIKDGKDGDTGVFIPMSDWNKLTELHEDLKLLVDTEVAAPKKVKLSELIGTLDSETAKEMLEYVAKSREEWEERLNKQF